MPKRSASDNKTRLVFCEGTSNKFWEIEVEGNTTNVTYGKVGTGGVTQVKEHGDEEATAKFTAKEIAGKIKKGYAPESGAAAPASEPAAKKAKAEKSPAAAKDNKTRLVFCEGTSNKFWEIEVEGNTTNVTYGKVGTGGVTQVKEHGDEEAAAKFTAKEIAGKIKKGYAPESGAAALASEPAAKKAKAEKSPAAAKAAPAAKEAPAVKAVKAVPAAVTKATPVAAAKAVDLFMAGWKNQDFAAPEAKCNYSGYSGIVQGKYAVLNCHCRNKGDREYLSTDSSGVEFSGQRVIIPAKLLVQGACYVFEGFSGGDLGYEFNEPVKAKGRISYYGCESVRKDEIIKSSTTYATDYALERYK